MFVPLNSGGFSAGFPFNQSWHVINDQFLVGELVQKLCMTQQTYDVCLSEFLSELRHTSIYSMLERYQQLIITPSKQICFGQPLKNKLGTPTTTQQQVSRFVELSALSDVSFFPISFHPMELQ